MSEVKVISAALFDQVADRAQASARRRMNYNFHGSAADNPHRFLNVLLKGTYVQPHRHSDPPKAESFIVLEGEADVIIFDDNGTIKERYSLGVESMEGRVWGVDLPPGVWHNIVARSERVVCFEVKPGPWEPANDKEFADWAPRENDPRAAAYLESLLKAA